MQNIGNYVYIALTKRRKFLKTWKFMDHFFKVIEEDHRLKDLC